MSARELFINKHGNQPEDYFACFHGENMVEFAEEYYQHKFSEITKEKIIDTIKAWETDETDGVHIVLRTEIYPMTYQHLAKAILNLLKEDDTN